jgi:hypothetical protein
MTVEAAIKTRMEAHVGLAALVSDRIYPHHLPQQPAYPAVSYHIIGARPRDRAMGGDSGIAFKRVQVSCWGKSYGQAVQVAEQVRQALQRWSGTEAGTAVQDIYLENQNEFFEADLGIYHHALDFEVVYGE